MPTKKRVKKKKINIMDKIKPVERVKKNMVMLAYGKAGTGKTEFASTFPTPILVLDVREGGLDTIANKSGIDVLELSTWEEFEEIFWELKEGSEYQTIVVDQISNLQDLGMEEIRRRSKKKKGELFTKQNWGQLSGLIKTKIAEFITLSEKYHLCLIAHERAFNVDTDDEDESVLAPNIGARVMPSVGSFLDGAANAIGGTYITEEFVKKKGEKEETRVVSYCMRTGPDPYYSTKVRRPVDAGPIPVSIKNPTYQKIADLAAGKSQSKKRKK